MPKMWFLTNEDILTCLETCHNKKLYARRHQRHINLYCWKYLSYESSNDSSFTIRNMAVF